jgi:hypothetical protein
LRYNLAPSSGARKASPVRLAAVSFALGLLY